MGTACRPRISAGPDEGRASPTPTPCTARVQPGAAQKCTALGSTSLDLPDRRIRVC